MAKWVGIYLDALEDERYRWALDEGGGSVSQTPATLEQIAQRVGGTRADIYVPTRQARITHVALPAKNRQRALTAIPFMIEDQLAVDVEECHIVPGGELPNGDVRVAVVAHGQMRQWLELLSSTTLNVKGIYPAGACFSFAENQPGTWQGVMLDQELLIAEPGGEVYAIDRENLEDLLLPRLNRADDEALEQLKMRDWRLSPTPEDRYQAEGVAWVGEDGWPWRANGHAVNLLSGPYQPDESVQRVVRAWVPAVALMLMIGTVLSLRLWMENTDMDNRVKATHQAIEQEFRNMFPDAKRIVNARAQTEHRLRQMRGESGNADQGFLTVLGRIAPAIANDRAIELRRLTYRNGEVDLEVQASNLQALDRHKEALSAATQGEVEIQSAAAADKGVISRLRINGGER